MKVKVCTCSQCRAKKRCMSSKARKFFKRKASKWRRRAKIGEVFNHYWA